MAKKAAKVAEKAGRKAKKKATKDKANKISEANPASPSNQRQNFSIRKIDNGYITSRSGYGKGGQYFERETFTRSQPKIVIGDKGGGK